MTIHIIVALLLAISGGVLGGFESHLKAKYDFDSSFLGGVLAFGSVIYLMITFAVWAMT